MRPDSRHKFNRYQVNVLIDNTATKGAPVIEESHPTYQNLLGRVEHSSEFGTLITDFTMIKPGALHRANGGYLLMDDADDRKKIIIDAVNGITSENR